MFFYFVEALPQGAELSEPIAQAILDEIELRKGINTLGLDGGMRVRLMTVSESVARRFSTLVVFELSK